MNRKIIYVCPFRHHETLEQFEARAALAKDAGCTHYDLSHLIDRSRWCLDDPSDPWLQWNLSNPNFFKRIVPDELKDFVPADIAQKELDNAKARGRILEKYGLKGMYYSWDPSWMPESLFEKRPQWRGPRIDHARRTKKMRFAACMDHEGVLAMYRDMVERLVREIPSVDTFFLHTNDSGSGMCWTDYLYNNANGPASCRHVNIGMRISRFLQTILDGAKDGGAQAPEVLITSQLTRSEANAVLPKLKEGMVLADWNGTIQTQATSYRTIGNAVYCFPFRHIPRHYALAESTLGAHDAGKLMISLEVSYERAHGEYMRMVKRAIHSNSYGPGEKNELLLEIASGNVGPSRAHDLVRAWELIYRAFSVVNIPNDGGAIFDLGLVMQRWINRPFVPFPLELERDEKEYYQKHLFQANGEDRMADMMNVQDSYLIDSRVGARFLDSLWTPVLIGNLAAAVDLLGQLKPAAVDEEIAAQMEKTRYSLRAIICFARTAINCAHFQTFMYEFSANDGLVTEKYIDMGDRDREFIYNVYRAEIDNIYELIGILGECPDAVVTGAREEDEDAFTYSPKLRVQLQKKIDIMMNHWQDFDRLFPRPNF